MNDLVYEEGEVSFMIVINRMWRMQPSDLLQGELLVLNTLANQAGVKLITVEMITYFTQ